MSRRCVSAFSAGWGDRKVSRQDLQCLEDARVGGALQRRQHRPLSRWGWLGRLCLPSCRCGAFWRVGARRRGGGRSVVVGEVWESLERRKTESRVSVVWKVCLCGHRMSGKRWFLCWATKLQKLLQTRTLLPLLLHSFYRFYGADIDIPDTEQDAASSPPIYAAPGVSTEEMILHPFI